MGLTRDSEGNDDFRRRRRRKLFKEFKIRVLDEGICGFLRAARVKEKRVMILGFLFRHGRLLRVLVTVFVRMFGSIPRRLIPCKLRGGEMVVNKNSPFAIS